MKLNAPEEIMFCYGNEKAANHFSLLTSAVAPEDIFCSHYKSSPLYTLGGEIKAIIVSDWQYVFES